MKSVSLGRNSVDLHAALSVFTMYIVVELVRYKIYIVKLLITKFLQAFLRTHFQRSGKVGLGIYTKSSIINVILFVKLDLGEFID